MVEPATACRAFPAFGATFMPATHIGCDEFRRTLRRPDRRAFVKAGAFGAGALTLDGLFRAEAQANPGRKAELLAQ